MRAAVLALASDAGLGLVPIRVRQGEPEEGALVEVPYRVGASVLLLRAPDESDARWSPSAARRCKAGATCSRDRLRRDRGLSVLLRVDTAFGRGERP